jgi:hypothetical protein
MFSPFSTDLSNQSINQLEQKVAELSQKYFATSNPQLRDQIATFIDIYKQELHTKLAQQSSQSGDNGLDNLINIS